MPLWIKICGNTSLADTELAIRAGADAVGFVFAPSPRRIDPAALADFASALPSSVERIGVFVAPSVDEVVQTFRRCQLTGVQLHSDEDAHFTAALRRELGPHARLLRVVHFGPDAAEQAHAIAADPNVSAVLVDSRTATAVGGTGIPFDWQTARLSLFAPGSGRKLIAAGGLKPENVTQAIQLLDPWGVDVASGVEAAPGKKDPARLADFVRLARSARP